MDDVVRIDKTEQEENIIIPKDFYLLFKSFDTWAGESIVEIKYPGVIRSAKGHGASITFDGILKNDKKNNTKNIESGEMKKLWRSLKRYNICNYSGLIKK